MGTPPEKVAEKLWSTMERLVPEAGRLYPYLSYPLGLPLEEAARQELETLDAPELQQAIGQAFCALIRALAQQSPLVLLWEDLHWADTASLQMLKKLETLTAEVPLLLLLVLRPGEQEAQGAILEVEESFPHCRKIRLSPLSRRESRQLLSHWFSEGSLPEATLEAILDKAEGNPLFLEELSRSLQEAGPIPPHRGNEVVRLEIPDTLPGAIMARVDRLFSSDKWVLQAASVIGRIFQQEVLAYIPGSTFSPTELDAALQELRRREFIRLRPPSPEDYGGATSIFKHAITREIVYHGLLLARRRELHLRVGEALETLLPHRRDELAATLGYHYTEAGRGERAIPYLLKAGDRARRLYACQEAIAHYQQVLHFFREGHAFEAAGRTLMKIGLTYHLAFDFHRAHQAYEEGFALWKQAAQAAADIRLPLSPHPLRIASGEPSTLDPGMATDVRSMAVVT